MLFGIPLLLIPGVILPFLGWQEFDPVTSRLVGAALMGIGGESLFSSQASKGVMKALLRLKIIWASAALMALVLGLLSGGPPLIWAFLVIFAVFLTAWIHYFRKLRD